MKVRARMHRECTKQEDGFTLVELLVALVIMTLITGSVGAAFATAINGTRSSTQRVRESNDAQIIATYLTRDAQAAGGTSPSTGVADPTLGVSLTDNAGCASASGALVVRFKWIDRSTPTAGITRVANYYYDSSTKTLIRNTCKAPAVPPTNVTPDAQLALSSNTASATASCAPAACPALPDTVSLKIVSTNTPSNSVTPYSFTLTASLRPQSQTAPGQSTSEPVPLLALGGGTGGCSAGATGLDLEGTPGARIYGDVVVNATDSGTCHAMTATGAVTFIAGGTAILAGGTCGGNKCPAPIDSYTTPLGDPFAGLTPPSGSCSTGTHPAPAGSNPTVYSPGVYTSAVTFGGANVLQPGNYVFCNGVTINNGSVAGTGVLLYIAHGGMTVTGGNTILSAATTGTYAGIVIWQADASTWSTAGNASVGLTGTLYAPKGTVALAGNADSSYQSIIAAVISIQGTHTITVGNAPATPLTITGPPTLPNWTRNQPYPATAVTSTGGSGAGLVWSASGLPAGLSIDPSLGTIAGTPTASGTFGVTVSLVDSLGDTASKTYTLTINPALAISGPASLPSRTVNRPYPSTAVTATGGTGAIAWSATGLPAGLGINAGTGVISGTPTAAGTTTGIIVTATDTTGATATRAYSVTINAAPSIMTNSLPNGTTTVAYSATLAGSGGTTPYTWSATGLPAGLAISTGGVISGTPTAAGNFSVSVTLTDASGATAVKPLSISVSQVLLITGPATLPAWTVNRGYPVGATTTVAASGGTAAYTWSATGLPAGLTINSGTGAITGLPTAAGTFTVVVTVKDSAAQQATTTKTYTLVINAAPAITTTNTSFKSNKSLNFTLAATGGTAPLTWSMSGAPAWISLVPSTGVLSGNPPGKGTFVFTVTVTDSSGAAASTTFTVTVT